MDGNKYICSDYQSQEASGSLPRKRAFFMFAIRCNDMRLVLPWRTVMERQPLEVIVSGPDKPLFLS